LRSLPAGVRADRRGCPPWARGVSLSPLRFLPHHPWRRGLRTQGPRLNASGEPPHDRLGDAPQHGWAAGRLDCGFATHQARESHAAEPAARRRSAGSGVVLEKPSMSAPAWEDKERAELARTWHEREGFLGRIVSVDHKTIGRRYIITAFVFFLLGGLEAALMRLQLAVPENRILNPDLYNQVFTMHGTTMMFFFAVPVMLGLGLYFVPLMVGTRNVPFPRLNAVGYWFYLFGGLYLYLQFLANEGPDAGWFDYVPLASSQYSAGHGVDAWAQTINFTEVSALIVAAGLIVTVFKQRAPGMSLNRIPLFVWAMLIAMVMIIFAMPAVIFTAGSLNSDRTVGTHLFNPAEGGDVLLWQHTFWFFGHPEVYIIFLPALGIISSILPAFFRREIFGYTAMVLALVATAFLGFSLWVHHMFATGLPQIGESFFTAASLMIAIPTGVQMFCWIATLRGSRPRWE